MNLLLATHIFLWFITGDDRLPVALKSSIIDSSNRAVLSVVSLWEAILKHRLGKLPLPVPPETYLQTQRKLHLIDSLVIDEPSIAHLSTLPEYHRDPFDRLLICQALEYDLTIVTVDSMIMKYPVNVL